LTFDDGPYIYTDALLDILASYGAKATFFITGINNGKGAIDEVPAYVSVIRRMIAEGHQVASHTWSHADLSTLTDADRELEMVKDEMALRNIIGKIPTYMRYFLFFFFPPR
jgi:peptidoglycan/xylan/chitin deacetylase (PgdA/CDA1 family)